MWRTCIRVEEDEETWWNEVVQERIERKGLAKKKWDIQGDEENGVTGRRVIQQRERWQRPIMNYTLGWTLKQETRTVLIREMELEVMCSEFG